jgi:hypothetical protein
MSDRLIPLARLVTPGDIFTRWRLSRDETAAVKIDKELQRARLPDSSLEHLLVTGEAVAAAHRGEVEWGRDGSARYLKLANLALDAGQLAVQLKGLIPPPWTGERQAFGAFVASLEDFLFCGVNVTSFAQHVEKIQTAQLAFAKLREYVPESRGRVSDALVGRLAWLASHSDPQKRPRALLHRGAMRPYRGFKRPQGTQAKRIWRRHSDILRNVASGASGRRPQVFMAALRTWLQAT